jgi:hypothetical protein
MIMANGDRADFVMMITAIASEYHWPARIQTEREVVSLSNAQLDALVGVYSLPPGPSGEPVKYEVTREGKQDGPLASKWEISWASVSLNAMVQVGSLRGTNGQRLL